MQSSGKSGFFFYATFEVCVKSIVLHTISFVFPMSNNQIDYFHRAKYWIDARKAKQREHVLRVNNCFNLTQCEPNT